MPRSGDHTRDRIVKAANALFYRHGIRAVSVDAIAEKAGITKKSLYYHFRSKDDLVEAYLVSRDQPNLTQFRRWFEESEGCAADRIAAIFRNVAKSATGRKWKGCGFLRTASELVDTPGHPAVAAARSHKRKLEAWLAEAMQDLGVMDAGRIARQVVLLLDGAFSAMLVHYDTDYVESAGEAASTLVRHATPSFRGEENRA